MIAVKPYQQPQSLNCFVTLFSKSLTQLLIAFILLLLEYNCFLRSGLVEKHNYQHFFFFFAVISYVSIHIFMLILDMETLRCKF